MKHNKEILNRFLTEKVAIALRTQEEWDEFMELLESETDLTWHSGAKPSKRMRFWADHKSETQVVCDKEYGVDRKTISYAKNYYKENGYEIIEFKELVKEKEMNLAEKLRFLADRWEDGKDFYIDSEKYSLNKGKLVMSPSGIQSETEINDLKSLNLRLAPQWTFTDDEKVILRNLPEQYKWIVRDYRDSLLYVCIAKPIKHKSIKNWVNFYTDDTFTSGHPLSPFNHLFQSIQWSDEEPCEFRKYL